jgi:two-component system, chemotaxis family, sensor kinase CheA
MTNDPASELLRIFREEAAEHLDGIVDCLLEVASGRANPETTDALFRHVHSIKGSAGMVGLSRAGEIAHEIEDVLEHARAAGELAPDTVEPLLRATDALRAAIEGSAGEHPEATTMPTSSATAPAIANAPSESQTVPTIANAPSDSQTAPPDPQADRSSVPARSIRVTPQKIDRMLDAVSETMLHHRRLEHVLFAGSVTQEDRLEREVDRGELLLEELQDAVLELRTVPLSSITAPLPRAVHDISTAAGKEIDLHISGAETQLDRVLLDGMSEAIGHLLRNAIAHGCELPAERELAGKPRRAQIHLHAEPRGARVAVEVSDDGRGVPPAVITEGKRRGSLIEVLTAPGFSTAESVSDVAGRGVGLDAVKRQTDAVGGDLAIETEPGAGTRVTLLMPVTLALLRVLCVKRAGQQFGVPLMNVSETVALDHALVLGGRASVRVREQVLALSDLALLLGIAAPDLQRATRAILMDAAGSRVAVACDQVIGELEVVVKPLGPLLEGVHGYLGAAILEDGRPMLILDPSYLLRGAGERDTALLVDTDDRRETREAPKVLVVDDQFTVRELQRSILGAAGYRVRTACDGREALAILNAEGGFDIVVTDVQMPEMDGLELLAAIRGDPERAALPVIVVSSRGREEDRERGAEAGADAYIVKNEFDQQALLHTVERLVGTR